MPSRLEGERWITGSPKRIFDITAASVISPLALPASAVGAAAFFAEFPINPFFLQKRLGRGNEPLRILKLRSMPFVHDCSDSSSGHADTRASKVGRILRKTTLDEAPQAVHILSGQMSIVGPRPLVPLDVEKTMDLLTPREQADWLQARTIAKPGWLSEFGNLSRKLDPLSDEYVLARVENDCRYIETASFGTDLKIIRDALEIGASMLNKTAPQQST